MRGQYASCKGLVSIFKIEKRNQMQKQRWTLWKHQKTFFFIFVSGNFLKVSLLRDTIFHTDKKNYHFRHILLDTCVCVHFLHEGQDVMLTSARFRFLTWVVHLKVSLSSMNDKQNFVTFWNKKSKFFFKQIPVNASGFCLLVFFIKFAKNS